MYFSNLTKISAAVTVLIGLSACGGGGSGAGTTATASSASVGAITGFGSVFVNGVEFDTAQANILIDGVPATEADLAVGMVAEIQGSDNGTTGAALSINVSDELEGVVQSNSIPAAGNTGTLVVMGQTITVNANTLFDSKVSGVTTIDQIAPGHIVEISGYSDGTGTAFATRVEVKAPDLATYLIDHADGVEVKGLVSTLDAAAQTFTIGSMPVSYAGAVVDSNVTLADNLYVEVKSVAGIDGTGTLVASKLELEDEGVKGRQGKENEELEMEGMISSAYDGSGFGIDGTSVLVTTTTELDGGATSSLLAGTKVEVEGTFNAQGQLVATKIGFEDEGDTELSGTVSNIVTTGVNSGTVTLQDGSVITITTSTIMKDSRNIGMVPDTRFNLQGLANGDFVDLHVFTDAATGNLVAVKLERDDA